MSSKVLNKVTVLGSGAFGTAMAQVATFKDTNQVVMWSKFSSCVENINKKHVNTDVFSQYQLSERISATTELDEALKGANLVLSCLPTQVLPDVLEENKNRIPLDVPFVSCSKGMIVSKEKFPSQAAHDIFGGKMRYCALSGPSFAQEMIEKNPTVVVIASKDQEAREYAQHLLSSKYFRIYTQDDVIGVEIAGALKNVLAIGVGLLEGLGYGTNTVAAFIARGSKEVQNFSSAHDADPKTFFGLSGIGDLILTCLGKYSRNRMFGYRLGKGEKIEDVLKTSEGVVEGLPTLHVVVNYAKKNNISLPLITVVYDFIYGKIDQKEALHRVMERDLEPEWFHFDDAHFHNQNK